MEPPQRRRRSVTEEDAIPLEARCKAFVDDANVAYRSERVAGLGKADAVHDVVVLDLDNVDFDVSLSERGAGCESADPGTDDQHAAYLVHDSILPAAASCCGNAPTLVRT
jgi:hypothetical protein